MGAVIERRLAGGWGGGSGAESNPESVAVAGRMAACPGAAVGAVIRGRTGRRKRERMRGRLVRGEWMSSCLCSGATLRRTAEGGCPHTGAAGAGFEALAEGGCGDEVFAVLRTGSRGDTTPPSWELRRYRKSAEVYKRKLVEPQQVARRAYSSVNAGVAIGTGKRRRRGFSVNTLKGKHQREARAIPKRGEGTGADRGL
jgi:hypothetical protein